MKNKIKIIKIFILKIKIIHYKKGEMLVNSLVLSPM